MSRVELSDSDFHRLAKLLHDAAGLSFDESRRESLAYCISERLTATGRRDVGAYLDVLEAPGGGSERQALLDEVTIPETHFFRNPPQVRALRKYVVPELLRQASGSRKLRVWSAGCSTGEEPYTVAMLIRELMPITAGWDIKIKATDVSNRALAAASAGRYAERSFVMTDPLDLQRWFNLDVEAGNYAVRDEIRELVEIEHHNLVTDPAPFTPGECDLILCRNVTIYFDRETTRRLMHRLHECLRPGGYLFLGHAETLWQISDAFTLTPIGDAFVYRRPIPGQERRQVLPDRRTEDELSPLRADRRRGNIEERRGTGNQIAPSLGAVRQLEFKPGPRPGDDPTRQPQPQPEHRIAAGINVDPLDSVRTAVAAGKYNEARDLAEEVIEADPLRADAHYLQGVAYTNLHDDGAATTSLRRAVYLDPESGLSHFMLGGALQRLGEPRAAARCYRAAAEALAKRPMDAVAVELGGRSVAELAATCMQLARQAEEQ